MKNRIVRKFTFETNSSSCHSLSIAYRNSDDYVNDLIEKFKSGRTEIVVTLKDYSSGNRSLFSIEDKLSYIFSDFLEDYILLLKIIGTEPTHERLIELKNIDDKFKHLVNLIEDCTGLPIFIEYNGFGCSIGEHSKGEGRNIVCESNSDIKQFLFDERNYVSLDSDE